MVTDDAQRFRTKRTQFLAAWEAACLKTPDQLPDVKGSALRLTWDMVSEGSKQHTVIRHGKREIWREPAQWKGYDRFREIVELLKAKYGSRLADLIPTDASALYLYGDSISSIAFVREIREALRNPQPLLSEAERRLRQIRANLADGWAFAKAMEAEERELADERAAREAEDAQPQLQRKPKPRRRTRRKRAR